MDFNPTAILTQYRLKNTSARIKVLTVLKNQFQPNTAQEIFNQIKTSDLATIYRTLNLFIQLKIVQEIDFKDGKSRYELLNNHHHHLVCQNCGRVQAIFNCRIDSLEKKLEQKFKFNINHHSLEFFGLCAKCK